MNDLISMLGYANGSPYNSAPYLDINTPEGLINMENTAIDLIGIDNLGTIKKMKAGAKKQYKFPGTKVREIPAGNPYQRGGLTNKQMFDFLFDDEEEASTKPTNVPSAPTVEEVDIQNEMNSLQQQQRMLENQENDDLATSILMSDRVPRGNPYGAAQLPAPQKGNPYTGQVLSSGQYGSQNIGEYGRQIYGQLANDLGYTPVVNSIFRSKAQNDALIAKGIPAVKNSWHLTGNAIDLKPTDWHRLSSEQKLYYTTNYDVVYHNKHFHIEPK